MERKDNLPVVTPSSVTETFEGKHSDNVTLFIEFLHGTKDFETFSNATIAYARIIGCEVDEKELKAVESKRQSILSKTGGKIDVFFCPCIRFDEKKIDVYRCPCNGIPGAANRGHLVDIEENGMCFCKLYRSINPIK